MDMRQSIKKNERLRKFKTNPLVFDTDTPEIAELMQPAKARFEGKKTFGVAAARAAKVE